ncbi:MAG: hypothetical protein DHS20C11_14970 [Lysobacteraceae bacterium]|nr:MAG: hypothetical protein DHS20C11_14970 [Xanthomonadaceae bacterium]
MGTTTHSKITPHFAYWDGYWGELFRDEDARFPSIIYGFDSTCHEHASWTFGDQSVREGDIQIPGVGACFGYVESGTIQISSVGGPDQTIGAGREMFFCLANGARIRFREPGRIVVVQAVGFRGLNVFGGPIESHGRLKYIDSCSDSVLVASPLLGDPCLNHLHFPSNIDQTAHTHPSTRAGMIARGQGVCITPDREYPLTAGRIFHIPKDGTHRFATSASQTMDVIAYHPDSDFGPTHEEHPMVNRTWVDGRKIDNSQGRHTEAQIVQGRSGVSVPEEYWPTA